jgi:hypothetical protein
MAVVTGGAARRTALAGVVWGSLAAALAGQAPVRQDPVTLDAPRPAIGWVVAPDAADTTVAAHGPVVRIVAGGPATVRRPDLVLRGVYTVRLQIEVQGPGAAVGLELADADGRRARCLAGAQGGTLQVGDDLAAVPEERAGTVTLALRVGPDGVTCLVDDVAVGTRPWPLERPATPGVWVGGAAEVRVTGLSVIGRSPTRGDGR